MDESEKRKQRLKAMRMEAAQSELDSLDSTNPTGHLVNPLAQPNTSLPAHETSVSFPRFDYYTDPLSAFSGGKKRSNVDLVTAPSAYTCSPGACLPSPLPGIYVGGNKVVHFTRKKETPPDSLLDFKEAPTCPIFPDCGFQQPNSGVILTCLDCFLESGNLYSFEYGVTPAAFLAKLRGGTCTTAASNPPETTIHRAMYLLQHGFGNYDVFQNNCEDFALYCKTGLLTLDRTGPGGSGQASSFINIPVSAIISSPFKLFMASPVGMATVTAGVYCAGRYMTDIGVRKDVIKLEVEEMAANLGLVAAPCEEQVEEAFPDRDTPLIVLDD